MLEGLPFFACPRRWKRYLMKIQEIPDSQLRVIGFIAMCLGLLMVRAFYK
jgi:uncharacterized protein YjeT (DUF2065 family)